jgi:tripartite-type tricarboxylate transporter receptor subunit TctC
MMSRRVFARAFVVVFVAFAAGSAASQDYPVKPVRIVTGETGGGNDFTARLLAQGLSAGLGQQVVVENRGGSTIIPTMQVAKAPPDGYTLLFLGRSFWTVPWPVLLWCASLIKELHRRLPR